MRRTTPMSWLRFNERWDAKWKGGEENSSWNINNQKMLFRFKLMGVLSSRRSRSSPFYFDPNCMGRMERYVGDVLRPLLPSDRYSCYTFFLSLDLEQTCAGATKGRRRTEGRKERQGIPRRLFSCPIADRGLLSLASHDSFVFIPQPKYATACVFRSSGTTTLMDEGFNQIDEETTTFFVFGFISLIQI